MGILYQDVLGWLKVGTHQDQLEEETLQLVCYRFEKAQLNGEKGQNLNQ